jgi:ribosome-binding ATPase YchF (GTP1/OBG family)
MYRTVALVSSRTRYRPARVVPSTIEFADIAGLLKGASKGEGLGNRFLSHIRNVDAIVQYCEVF